MEGTIQSPGDIYFAYYIDGVIANDLPDQNTEYTLDEKNSTCNNGVVPGWDYSTWKFMGDYSNYQKGTNKRTKCTLYFVKNETVTTALGELSVYPYTPDFTDSACNNSSNCSSYEKGIYQTTDEDGITYYYRGSVENNYFYFANYWWRVIRINGDGTIRLIYDGTIAHTNEEQSEDEVYISSAFSSGEGNNMYVGYMYTSGEAHGLGTSSVIKTVNDTFYQEHLANYSSYIDTNAGFCGDRSTLNLQSGVGTEKVITYNKGYYRVLNSSPNLVCEDERDLYTVSTSNQGNKALTYPVGLITIDEVMLAGHSGGIFESGHSTVKSASYTYLTTMAGFWTMTPAGAYNPWGSTAFFVYVFVVHEGGWIGHGTPKGSFGLKPVINIRSDVEITGNGTIDSPYQVV